MGLEYNTQKLYEFYKSDPNIKRHIDSLPTNRWLPELQRMYDTRYNSNLDEILDIAAALMIFMGALYFI